MTTQDNRSLIYKANKEEGVKGWYVVNDGVMGGLSKGIIKMNDDEHAVFEGYVTTENNGGFSSVRYPFEMNEVSEFKFVNIKLKGDGKNYQFRIKETVNQDYSYIHEFKTSGDWEKVSILLSEFYPSFRGNKLNRPNFPGKKMEEVTFLIGNKKKESFSLEIESIYLN